MKLSARVCRAMAAYAALIAVSATSAYAAAPWTDPGRGQSVGVSSAGAQSNLRVYAEDAPCNPTPTATPARRVARRPRVHHVHRVRRPAAPEAATLIPIVHRAAVRRATLHKVVARPHHRRRLHRPTVVAASAPKRCMVMRSERLNSLNLAFDGAPTLAPDFSLALLSSGALPDLDLSIDIDSWFSWFDIGWVDTVSPVRAVPEPQTWLLMILGVGLCGAALRRTRRAAVAAT